MIVTEAQQLDELQTGLLDAALDAVKIFKKTKDDMTPIQAAQAASLFTGQAVNLKKAVSANFTEVTVLPLNILIKLSDAIINAEKPAVVKVIEI